MHTGFGLTHERTDRREALSNLVGDCSPLSSGLGLGGTAKPARMMAATIERGWIVFEPARPFNLAAIDLRRACIAYNLIWGNHRRRQRGEKGASVAFRRFQPEPALELIEPGGAGRL